MSEGEGGEAAEDGGGCGMRRTRAIYCLPVKAPVCIPMCRCWFIRLSEVNFESTPLMLPFHNCFGVHKSQIRIQSDFQ